MTEPLVIQKMKKLGPYVSVTHQDNNLGKYFSVYDDTSCKQTYPKTYKDLLEDLDRRILDHGK